MITPTRIQSASNTFNGASSDATCPYSNRGVRMVSGMGVETMEKNEETIREILKYTRKMMCKEITREYPEFSEIIKDSSIYIDPHTPGKYINLNQHGFGLYDMNDASFNLIPDRAVVFLSQYESMFPAASDLDGPYQQLKQLLNQKCSNGLSCYYREQYPEFKCAGPIALPDCVRKIFLIVLPAAGSSSRIINTLIPLLYKMTETYANKNDALVKSISECIVCTIMNNAEKEFNKNGGLEPEGRKDNIYLINIDGLNKDMFIPLIRPEYNKCVAGVDVPTKYVPNFPKINFRNTYEPYMFNGNWTILKTISKGTKRKYIPDTEEGVV